MNRPGDKLAFVVHNLTRRDFLVHAGLASAGLTLGIAACNEEVAPPLGPTNTTGGAMTGTPAMPTMPVKPPAVVQTPVDPLWVSIGDDGSVQVTVHRSEMGQGVRTACAMILADELGANWDDVRVVQAVGHPLYGNQITYLSTSMVLNWVPLRSAGASAREMLAQAAATALQVPRAELKVANSQVTHAASGRSMAFKELAAEAGKLPVPVEPPLRDKSEYQIIGRPNMRGVDACDVTQGKAIYGIDVTLPGMLYASIERSPTRDGTLLDFDASEAMAVPGVMKVVQLDATVMGPLTNHSVAVVGADTWAALSGRKKLKVRWDAGPGERETTADFRQRLAQTVMQPGMMAKAEGDAEAALAMADPASVVEAQYRSPYLVHSPMEPPVCVAHVQGDRCEIWAPTQTPQAQFPLGARESAAMMLGIPPENVTVYVSLLGGGFGRKSQMDFILEAVQLSKLVGAPVKVTWTREDEIHHGFYRPENQQLLRAAVAPDGTVSALLGRSVFQSYFNLFVPGNVDPTPFELDMGWTNLPFAIPNLRLEAAGLPSDVRIGWLRSVHNLFHAFALSSFVDELAAKAGTDTIAMYRRMLGPNREIMISVPLGGDTPPITYPLDTGRIAAVVDQVAGMGLWGKAVPEGEGIGFAAHFCNSTVAALVMHVAVGPDKVIHVKEVDYAIDCGTVVNPDGVRAQVEGGLVYALSAALFGEITLDAGKVVESNFNDYPVLRIDRMPKVNLVTLASELPPMGIGEPPTPVVAPALANAVFAATGTRVRELPFRKQGFG